MSTSRDRSRRHRPPGPQRDPGIGVPSPCLSARWRWAGSKAPDIRIEALVATLGAAVGNLSAVLTQTGRGSAQIEHPAGERVPGEAVEPEDRSTTCATGGLSDYMPSASFCRCELASAM